MPALSRVQPFSHTGEEVFVSSITGLGNTYPAVQGNGTEVMRVMGS